MTGYAVSSRIQRVEVAALVAAAPADPVRWEHEWEPMARDDDERGALEELVGRSPWARLRDLREDVVTGWNQTTFFLFDSESWR
ncbi:MAG TPA: hypothetical protein VH813_10940 [Candidatus Limnocylindrales bacterium]